jgi:hypothetical protein
MLDQFIFHLAAAAYFLSPSAKVLKQQSFGFLT